MTLPHTAPPSSRLRRIGRALAAAALTLGALPVVALTTATSAAAVDNGLGRTPVMGFNDWNAFGCDVSADLIEQTADLFVTEGLKAAGYQYLNIDDCWMTKSRDADGHLVADPAKFPEGIKAVADYVHARGLKLGIYESAGLTTCQGYPGSLGHETTDAQDFADWGVDLLKYDNCGTTSDVSSTQAHYVARYTAMADALEATGRDILYSVCEWGTFEPWTWAPAISNMWRTTGDISDSYASMLSIVKQNAVLSSYAGPGAFNDPDMLEIGNGGMTDTEYRSEFSLWSMMAAPLIAGTDLRDATDATLAIYKNTDVIAIDQDPLGKQATLLSDADGKYVFAKQLSNGDVAVALFNSTDTTTTISTTATAAGLRSSTHVYALKDLWSKATTESTGTVAASVPAHGTVIYRISAPKTVAAALKLVATIGAQTVLAPGAADARLTGGGSTVVTVKLTDNAAVPLTQVSLNLTAPNGWKVTAVRKVRNTWVPGHDAASIVLPGGSSTQHFQVVAPAASAAIASATLTATGKYRDVKGAHTAGSPLTEVIYSPLSTSDRTADTTGTASIFGRYNGTLAIQAAGAGVQAASSSPFGSTAAADSYAAIYLPDAVSSGSTVAATVTALGGPSGFGSNGSAGVMVRNDATAADGIEGVVLFLSSSGRVQMAYAANGGAIVDTTIGGRGAPGAAGAAVPVQLKLVRANADYTGSYSTDGGITWTTVGTATLPAAGAAAVQDAAIYHSSGVAGSATEADFTGFTVS